MYILILMDLFRGGSSCNLEVQSFAQYSDVYMGVLEAVKWQSVCCLPGTFHSKAFAPPQAGEYLPCFIAMDFFGLGRHLVIDAVAVSQS